MKNPRTVFICSTYGDLSPERDAVLGAIRKLPLQPDSMEIFGARSSLPIATCLEEVRRSDLLVVIVGHKYGTLIPNDSISFSEAEYSEGYRLGKPCLVYLRDENVPILPKHIERDPQKMQSLENFKERLKERHTVATFKGPDDLAVSVAIDLSRIGQTLEKPDSPLAVSSGDIFKEIHLLEDDTPTNASQYDPTISPELFDGILMKMREDFRRGALSSPRILKMIHEKAEADLTPISSITDTGRFTYLDVSVVANDSWWGIPNRNSINILCDTVQALGRPILVSCSSVNVGAYTVLKGFSQLGIPIEVVPDDASGREQVISIGINPKFDFVVCADAPFFLDSNHNVRLYTKIFEIYHEEQFILRKRGRAMSNFSKLHVYQASSAKQQFLLDRANKDKSPLPEKLEEEPFFSIVDFTLVSEFMNPGDMVIAWGALAWDPLESTCRHASLSIL